MVNCITGHNLRRFLIGLHVEGKPPRLAASGIIWFTVAIAGSCAVIALVAGYVQKTKSSEKVSRRVEAVTVDRPCRSQRLQSIQPLTANGVVGAYVDIVFDNCLKVEGIKVIKGPTGLFISFSSKKQRDGIYRDLAFPANAET